MLQLGRELDLAQEALGAERGGELGAEHLERDQPLVPQVAREIDRGHAALPELALDGVAVGQRGLETSSDFGQMDSPARIFAPRLAPPFPGG